MLPKNGSSVREKGKEDKCVDLLCLWHSIEWKTWLEIRNTERKAEPSARATLQLSSSLSSWLGIDQAETPPWVSAAPWSSKYM